MTDELQHLDQDTRKLLKWVAAEYEYLTEVITDLGELKDLLDEVHQGKRELKQALREMRYASRSERRVSKFEKRMEEDVEKLGGMLPPELKSRLREIENKVRMATRVLLKQASLYEGHIRQELGNIHIKLGLLELEKQKKIVDLAKVRLLKSSINDTLDRVLVRIGNTIQWAAALGADLKEAQKFERALAHEIL